MQDWTQNDGLTLDPEFHEVLPSPGEWVTSLNREFNRDDLMLYRHKQHGTFVLGVWWDKGRGIICELIACKEHPDRLNIALREDGELGPGSFTALPHKSWIFANFIRPAEQRKQDIFKEMADFEHRQWEENLADEQETRDIGNLMAKGKKGQRRHWADHPYVKDLQNGQMPPIMG